MQDDGMYILPQEVVQKFEQSKLGFNGLRLLHGVYHLSYVLAQGGLGAMAVASMQPRTIRASAIHENVGPKGAKDTRHMRDAIAALDNAGFFRCLRLTENARGLEYQFSQGFIRATQGPRHPFARLDTSRIAECRSETDILFYTRVAMHERQDVPFFNLPRIGDGDPRWSWAGSSERWLRSAENIRRMTGHDFLILPESTFLSAAVTRVRVKFAPNGSRWKVGALYRSEPGTRPYEIVAEGRRLLTGEQAKAKLKQQRIG